MRKIRPERWLTLVLLLLPTGSAITQEPQSQQKEQVPEVKLPALLSTEPVKQDPKDDELRKLLKARYNEAVAEMKARFTEFQAGKTTIDSMRGPSQRLVEAGLELNDGPKDRVKLLERLLEVAKEVERINQDLCGERHGSRRGTAPGTLPADRHGDPTTSIQA